MGLFRLLINIFLVFAIITVFKKYPTQVNNTPVVGSVFKWLDTQYNKNKWIGLVIMYLGVHFLTSVFIC